MTKTVRQFSPAGPCLVLGTFVNITPKRIAFRDDNGDPTRDAKVMRIGRRSYVHMDPCPRCRDHDKTKYPNGYMD